MEIPFYINHGHRCAQVAIKIILGARHPEKKIGFKELDKLTFHRDPEITLPVQLAHGLYQLQIPFEYYVNPHRLAIAQTPKAQNLAQKKYGHRVASNINYQGLKESSKTIQGLKGIITTKDKPSIKALEEMIQQEKIPICLVNWDIFRGKQNKFAGHYIIITGIEKDKVVYHNTGPYNAGANKKVSKDIFQKSWNLSIMDHGLIVA